MCANSGHHSGADEFDLIAWIREQLGRSPDVPIGPGDDCAGVYLPAGGLTLVTTDMAIDGVHFRSDEASPREIGHKAIARAVSDIAAMAGTAEAIVVAVATPGHLSMSWLQEMVRGMIAAAEACDARLVGGDVASGDLPLTITVSCCGTGCKGRALRSNARATDMLLVTGELGGSLLGRHLSFLPRLKEARWLCDAVELHAMIDISDGLAADANHLAEESGVAIELWEEAIPVSDAAERMAKESGRTPLDHALHDGEDYELLFTVGAREASELVQRPDLPVRMTCIGEVTDGAGLFIGKRGEGRRPLEPKGWRHAL